MTETRTYRTAFRPPWWATLGLLVGLGIMLTAGFWQMRRADEKTVIFQSFDSGEQAPLVRDLIPPSQARELRFRRISLYGQFDPDHQILLDSMMYRGRSGYHVLTPMRVGNKSIMVNRGWIQADFDRTVMPMVDIDPGPRKITGRIDLLPRSGLKMAQITPVAGQSWPIRMLYPTAAEMAEQTGYRLEDYQLLLDPDEADGFNRDWRPDLLPPERHFGYAVQWFGLAFTLTIIYIFLNFRRTGRSDANG